MAGAKPKDKPTKKKVQSQATSSYLKNKKKTKRQIDQAFDHLKPSSSKKKGK